MAQARARVGVGGVKAAAGLRPARKSGGVGGSVVVGWLAVVVQVIADSVQLVQAVNFDQPVGSVSDRVDRMVWYLPAIPAPTGIQMFRVDVGCLRSDPNSLIGRRRYLGPEQLVKPLRNIIAQDEAATDLILLRFVFIEVDMQATGG